MFVVAVPTALYAPWLVRVLIAPGFDAAQQAAHTAYLEGSGPLPVEYADAHYLWYAYVGVGMISLIALLIFIARGSGTSVQEVNQLVRQFNEMRNMMKQMGGGGTKSRKKGKKGKKGRGGGRTTPKGGNVRMPKNPLELAGLEGLGLEEESGPPAGGLSLP